MADHVHQTHDRARKAAREAINAASYWGQRCAQTLDEFRLLLIDHPSADGSARKLAEVARTQAMMAGTCARLYEQASAATLYQAVVAYNVPHAHHESDLYVPLTVTTMSLLRLFKVNAQPFRDATTGEWWLDVFGAYDPFWQRKRPQDVGVLQNSSRRQ